jgi:hypothetical protein
LLVLAEIIFFDPEDGDDKFLRNVGCNSTDYTASQKMILFIIMVSSLTRSDSEGIFV